MKKSTILIFLTALIILSACQNNPDSTKNAADRAKEEKAVTSSQIKLIVNPPAGESPTDQPVSTVPATPTEPQPNN